MNKSIETPKQANKFKNFFTRRQFRYGWYATAATVLFIALVIVLNLVVDAAETKWALKIDATGNAVTDFSDKTYEVLASVEDTVYIHTIYTANSSRSEKLDVEAITNKFAAKNGNIIVDNINPNTEPGRVNAYKDHATNGSISEGSVVVTNADESRVKVIPAADIYSKELNWYAYYTQGTESYTTVFNAEGALTSALMYVTSDSTPRVIFLSGQNEISSDYCSTLTSELTNENYDVLTMTLGQTDITLEAGDTLIILMPELDLTDDEYTMIRDAVENGTRMLFVTNPGMDLSDTPNFESLLSYYGFAFKDGFVVEDETSTSNWINSVQYLVPNIDSESDITSSLTSSRIILPGFSCAIADPDPRSGFTYTKLLTSSSKAYLKSNTSESIAKEDGDEVGTFTYAMSVLKQNDVYDTSKDVRIVVLGSPYLIVDSMMSSTNNLDFAVNTIDWLVNRTVSASVRTKDLLSTTLTISNSGEQTLWGIITVGVIPLIAFVLGIIVYFKRRRL